MKRPLVICLTSFTICACGLRPRAGEPVSPEQAVQALKRACEYYREEVASHGGYVYYYSLDLKDRWGEGKADADTIFVQPPGTPTVGRAYLEAYAATEDPFYLDAAKESAQALVYGQLESGGWTQKIHFGVAERLGKYRHGGGGDWNVSSLDDDQSQAALRFLIRLDEVLKFENEEVHEAVVYGLDALLAAQFPNGGFPQGWREPVADRPVIAAGYPDYEWRTEGKIKNYWDQYTLNDGLAGTVAETLIEAHKVYGDSKYKNALRKLGDFLMLAQMPAPQPGWCQQYNADMIPIWARKFEPPAISGSESQDVMETLIRIAEYTSDAKYLEPVPRALDYYERSLLADGRLARFYELRTNKPLYMDSDYRLTYDDSDVPDHYAFKVDARLENIRAKYEAAKAGQPANRSVGDADINAQKARGVIDALDEKGRWISAYAGDRSTGQPGFEDGFRYLSSKRFCRNVAVLSQYLSRTREP